MWPQNPQRNLSREPFHLISSSSLMILLLVMGGGSPCRYQAPHITVEQQVANTQLQNHIRLCISPLTPMKIFPLHVLCLFLPSLSQYRGRLNEESDSRKLGQGKPCSSYTLSITLLLSGFFPLLSTLYNQHGILHEASDVPDS